jgi:hypothetical protein
MTRSQDHIEDKLDELIAGQGVLHSDMATVKEEVRRLRKWQEDVTGPILRREAQEQVVERLAAVERQSAFLRWLFVGGMSVMTFLLMLWEKLAALIWTRSH